MKKLINYVILLLVVISLNGCIKNNGDEKMPTIYEAKAIAESQLLGIEGVTGVGISVARNTLVVYVLSQEVTAKIPGSIAGYSVEVVVTGPFRAL